jgi:hypothetical protein
MPEPRTVQLPAPPSAVAAGETTVWCVVGSRLLSFEAAGSPVRNVPAPEGVSSLAAAGEVLAAAGPPGVITWLDPREDSVGARLSVGGEPELLAGGGAVWAYDRSSGRARRLVGEGAATEPVAVPDADRIAVDGERVWWTSREDTLLHGGDRTVDVGVGPDERGGLVACGGSVWVSAPDALLRVGAWAAELGPPLSAPEGPVEHLACAGGILVGGSGRRGLFVLDPSVDADVRHLDVDLGGDLAHLVATRAVAWAFPSGRAEARLVSVRLGE